MNILVIDDSDTVHDSLKETLGNQYGELKGVRSPEEALALIHEMTRAASPLDCILMDINLPGMNGIKLTGIIKDLKGLEDTPIVCRIYYRYRLYQALRNSDHERRGSSGKGGR